ncbi:hypothetical protein KNU12_gp111 [Klebsiella phage KP179]|uniref:Uncharacterized protein n=1 Tax=Klebsiella phage KP179 TaxID=2315700 RepID=A0A386K6R9_9CAUD|nr:hypothetical protein [Klebsiella pneumoniae]YP_010098551.1 hypothetical protein KNU12_gp111 [Klebsiella phage KP179]AYD80753.1 hypothetical protein [Klebsiella phage KP179]
MSNLYLPSEPPVYNYVYKFDQIDYALVPGIGATVGAMCTFAAIDIMHLTDITPAVLFGILLAWWGTSLLIMGLIECSRWVKWSRNNYKRKAEWKEQCKNLTLEWNRKKSLEFVKEVRRK